MSNRILQANVELDNATKALRKAEKEASKDKKPLPAAMFDRYMEQIRLCRRNLDSAHAADGAMNKYPPIAVLR